MITCTITYQIDPKQVDAFEAYAQAWIFLVEKFGGTHHGYWLPHEGANDVAWAKFSFPSLADYENYRRRMSQDPDCKRVFAHAETTGCIQRYDRTFTRPVLNGVDPANLDLVQ